ncbi:MAG: hypothetical protein MJ090_01285 [Clostridia bacterium]|nr:hypothetical protein [Clostridia bacterium]
MKTKLKLFEITLFPLLGVLMTVSKIALEFLPNIHILGMLIMVYTLVFGKKALIPIYIYVFLIGLISGFNVWWIPYLYIWTVLWAVTMIIPKKLPSKYRFIIYATVCSLHGFLFGTLYSPVQAIVFGLSFKQTVAWIISGFPFDALHGIGNLFFGFFIIPLSSVLKKAVDKLY